MNTTISALQQKLVHDFVSGYYSSINQSKNVAKFYSPNANISHGLEATQTKTNGNSAGNGIQTVLNRPKFLGSKIRISDVTVIPNNSNSLLLTVIGDMKYGNDDPTRFVQSLVLNMVHDKLLIVSDIFRVLIFKTKNAESSSEKEKVAVEVERKSDKVDDKKKHKFEKFEKRRAESETDTHPLPGSKETNAKYQEYPESQKVEPATQQQDSSTTPKEANAVKDTKDSKDSKDVKDVKDSKDTKDSDSKSSSSEEPRSESSQEEKKPKKKDWHNRVNAVSFQPKSAPFMPAAGMQSYSMSPNHGHLPMGMPVGMAVNPAVNHMAMSQMPMGQIPMGPMGQMPMGQMSMGQVGQVSMNQGSQMGSMGQMPMSMGQMGQMGQYPIHNKSYHDRSDIYSRTVFISLQAAPHTSDKDLYEALKTRTIPIVDIDVDQPKTRAFVEVSRPEDASALLAMPKLHIPRLDVTLYIKPRKVPGSN